MGIYVTVELLKRRLDNRVRSTGSIYDDMPTLSKSRIMTAIWARLAASATRVKSLRKLSVEGALMPTGAGGTILLDGDDWTEEADDVCCETGDWTGRSILLFFPRAG